MMEKESKSADEEKNESLSDRFQRAISLIESSPDEAVSLFTNLQEQSANLSLFSSNESFSEISTGSLPFLALEHYLAVSLSRLGGTPGQPDSMIRRRNNMRRACDLWAVFLERLDKLEQLKPEEKSQYSDLIELSSRTDDNNSAQQQQMPPPVNRDVKIARFRSKQAAEKERERLKSLIERRNRLGVAEDDEMDGYDQDSLSRSVAVTTLEICKAEALDEFSSAIRELPMISMMVKAEEERQCQDRHKGKPSLNGSNNSTDGLQDTRPPPPPQKPLQLTHITQDSTTGQLQVRREEVRGQVFRPGWNQPTMTLEELAERETADAMARDQRQKEAEAASMGAPRRYDQLKKDGMEDNAELVDASAILDRQWDDWKDENPRGSGNKRGDVGDRNF